MSKVGNERVHLSPTHSFRSLEKEQQIRTNGWLWGLVALLDFGVVVLVWIRNWWDRNVC